MLDIVFETGSQTCLTLITELLEYLGCPLIPCERPSLVPAIALHWLGKYLLPTHSYTSIVDPGKTVPQLFFLKSNSPCSYHTYFTLPRSHHSSPTCSSIQLDEESTVVPGKPIL